jgi:uncharacterized repeat protein (TIGR01451 family)
MIVSPPRRKSIMSSSGLMLCRSVCGVAAATLSLAGFATAFAGVNAFTPLGPEGGPVNKVEFHPTDGAIAYLATDSGFHRSSDAGVSWQLAAGSPVNRIVDFAIDPNDGNRVFVAAINYGLFVSTDAGATLTRVMTFQSNYGPSNVEMSRDGTLYVTADTRVLRSTDGGTSWHEGAPIVTTFVLPSASLRVDPLDSNRLYVFNGTEGLRSMDGGGSWSSFSLPAPTRDLVVAAVMPPLLFAGTFAGVMVSSNDGTNWSPAGLADATLALAVDAADAATVYAGTYPTGLFRTTNQGGQWSNVHGNARSGEIASIAVSRVQPGLVLLGGTEGLVRSTTAGPPWTSANSGFISTSIHELLAVPSSQRIYAASMTGGGVFALEHGAPWFEPANIAGLVALQPNVTGFVVLDLLAQGLPPDRLIVATNGGYALSLDGGEHWQFVTMGGWRPSSLAGSPTQPQNLIASGAGGLRYSLDGGTIWTPSIGLPQSSETSVIAFATSAPSTAYVAPVVISGGNVPQGIYKSTDGGAYWLPVNTGIPAQVGNAMTYVTDISVDPRTEQTAYAATSVGLFKTVDGGASWTAVNWAPGASPTIEVLRVAIDSMRPDTVYAARNGLVRRSVDAGVNWDSVANVFPPLLSINALLADPFRRSTLVIGTYSNGAREMTVATDVEIVVDLPSAPLPYGSTPTAHSYTVRNLGLVHASDVQTVIQLPSSAGAVTASATAGSCTVQGTTVTCLQPVLLAGRATQVTVSSTYSAAGNVSVQASVQSYEPDTQPSNNSVQATMQVAEVADLSVAVSAPAAVTEGSAIAYSVVVANAGPSAATAVTASVQLAAGLTVATATSSRGSCTPSGSLVTCLVGDLADDSNATIAITTTPASPGTFQATANVAAAGFDPASTNNTAPVSTTATALGAGGNSGGSGGGGSSTSGGGSGGGGGGGGSTSWPLLALLVSAAGWRRLRERGGQGRRLCTAKGATCEFLTPRNS